MSLAENKIPQFKSGNWGILKIIGRCVEINSATAKKAMGRTL
jgi:hypothetical protein